LERETERCAIGYASATVVTIPAGIFFFSASLSFFLSFFRLFDNALKWDEKKKKRENDQEI